MKDCIITISRGYGSGGKQIAQMLAKELDIPCYDREIMKLASDESGINESLFAKNDEKVRRRFMGLLSKHDYEIKILSPDNKHFTSEENLFNYQAYVIREIAKKGPCVFIGRAADFVLKDFPNVVRVNIEAPFDVCVRKIMEMYSVSEKEAANRIVKTDNERDEYYRYHTGRERIDPLNYDISINSHRVGWENSVRLIRSYCEMK